MSSICCLLFFLFFFGDIGGTAAAGVFGVAVDVVGDAADSCVFGVGVAGVGVAGVGDTGAGVAGGSGVAASATATATADGAFICFWGGDDDEGLFSPFLGDPLLFWVTSVQPSWLFNLGWTWPGPWAFASLMVVVVAAAMSFVVVVAVGAALSLFSGRWGQNLAMWPICLHPQHLGRLPSTITIICRSLLINVSGMALKPPLVRHSRKA